MNLQYNVKKEILKICVSLLLNSEVVIIDKK